jgi:hypothetical protein
MESIRASGEASGQPLRPPLSSGNATIQCSVVLTVKLVNSTGCGVWGDCSLDNFDEEVRAEKRIRERAFFAATVTIGIRQS